MRSRLLSIRVWLEEKGLFPKGKLAFVTLYFLALDVFLFLIQKVVGLVRPSYVSALNGWILFLSFVIALLACVLAARWASSRLLWRLRNRLIVTYVFIGVIPLMLLLAIAGLALRLFAGQFATYIVSSRLDAEIKSLHASNLMRGRQVAAELNSGQS